MAFLTLYCCLILNRLVAPYTCCKSVGLVVKHPELNMCIVIVLKKVEIISIFLILCKLKKNFYVCVNFWKFQVVFILCIVILKTWTTYFTFVWVGGGRKLWKHLSFSLLSPPLFPCPSAISKLFKFNMYACMHVHLHINYVYCYGFKESKNKKYL